MLGKAVPSAHEVDSGTLSALLLATMRSTAARAHTYPPGVYDRLEQQVETQPLAGAEQRARTVSAHLEPTYEHTEPWGSDSPGGEAPAGVTRQGEQRRRIGKLGRERAKPAARARRPRRLVRLASELRTTLTRIVEAGFVGSRAYWIAIGSVVGLASALLLITLAIDHGPRARPAPPGLPSSQRRPGAARLARPRCRSRRQRTRASRLRRAPAREPRFGCSVRRVRGPRTPQGGPQA